MLEKGIKEINDAGELDHPNIAKTFMRFGDEHYTSPTIYRSLKISDTDY
jgi:hypothetical protein